MRWFEKQGIVAKIMANNCIVLTPEGTYYKIALPSKETRVGAEFFYRNPGLAVPLKPLMMVASLLILFMSYPMLSQAILPQAVANVSLDINSGLEMAVDKHMRVIDVQCFNDDATNLVKQLNLKGKGLNDALTAVVNQAIMQNYIKAGQDNLMISTISPSGADPDPVDQAALYQVLEDSMTSRGYTGQVKIYTASNDFHTEAENQKMSTGKYLIYEQLVKSGNNVSVDDINGQTVCQLADTYKLDLLPNYKKIMIQTTETNQDQEITVDDNGQNVAIEDYDKSHGSKNVTGDLNNNRPDTNVSRSYPASKSRITQNIPSTSRTTSLKMPGENSTKNVVTVKAVEIPTSDAAKIKSKFKAAKVYVSRPLF